MFSADMTWTPMAEIKKEPNKGLNAEQDSQPRRSTESNKASRRRPWQFLRKTKEGESPSRRDSKYNERDENWNRSPSLALSTLQDDENTTAPYSTQCDIEGISEAPNHSNQIYELPAVTRIEEYS